MDTVDTAASVVKPTARRRYAKVNAIGLPRDKLDDREALSAARRLYRLGRKLADRPLRGPIKLKVVYGNLHTRVRRGYVNPCRGWHGLVHDISHSIERLHTAKHEWLELQLAQHVRDQGWLGGKFKRPEKPKPPAKEIRYQRVLSRIEEWERKRRRANNAIKKLFRQKAYYERQRIAA